MNPMVKRQKNAEKSSAEAEMKAFLASKVVDQISDYNQRGRTYHALSDNELTDHWKAIWDLLAVDPVSTENRDIQADLGSEFALRQQEPPWKLVQRQIDIYLKGAERAWQEQQKENPEAEVNADEALDEDLEEFTSRRNRAN
jgi:hypothetical protein